MALFVLYFPFLLLLKWAGAADIVFASGDNCTGQPLYGGRNLTSVPCYDLSSYHEAQSVVLSEIQSGQTVRFYSDNLCQVEFHSVSEDICYSPSEKVLSFLVDFPQSPVVQPNASTHTTDLALYDDVRLSNYEGLGLASPYNIDLRYTNFYAGFSTDAAAIGITMATAGYTCYQAASDPTVVVSWVLCVAPVVSTGLAYLGRYFLTKAGNDVRESFNSAMGQFNQIRSVDGPQQRPVFFNYTSPLIEDASPDEITHAGYIMRKINGTEQITSMYHINPSGDENGGFHVASFYHAGDNKLIHHIHSAAETAEARRKQSALETREYAYNSLRWKQGGLDLVLCHYNSNAANKNDGFFLSLNEFYKIFYDQLSCTVTGKSLTKAHYIWSDIYNEYGTLRGEVGIKPYADENSQYSPTCVDQLAELSQDCILS